MNKKLKDSFYGLIPDDWNSETFQDCLTGFSSGSTPSRDNPNYFNGNINWITSGELNYNIIYQTKECVTEEAIVKSNLKILPKGTFLIAITGLEAEKVRGACGIVGINSVSNQSCMALYPKEEKIFTNYLFYFYSFFGAKLAFQFCQGTKQQSYNAQLVKILPIIYPSLKEQNAIANCLSIWDEAIEKQQKLIEAKEIRHKALMQKLLSGKKRLPGFTDEWKEVKLGDLFSERNETKYDDLPLLSIGQEGVYPQTDSNKRDISNGDKSKYKRIVPGDIGYNTMRMWQGRSALSNLEGIVSPAYTILTPKENVDSYFFSLLFKTTRLTNLFWRNSQGLVDDTLNCKYKDFSIIKCNIPSYEEQITIKEILKISEAEIEIEKKKVDQLKEQKKALMQKLLTGKVRLPLQN